jgi:glutathione synthase/RimK-type ligase-like ATP-grasp enzyme
MRGIGAWAAARTREEQEEDVNNQKKIGLLIGEEWSWPSAFIEEVNRRKVGIVAELVNLAGTRLGEPCHYDVIVDRISHELPYYRTHLKAAMLSGTRVINNPVWTSTHDRFFNASVVGYMGFAQPRMVALPSHSYMEGIGDDALRNLAYPIPWEEHISYLGGFPVVLRPVHDSGSKRVYVLDSYEDLWRSYNKTGAEPMMLREHISWDKYVRCMCIGQCQILPIQYTPGPSWSTRYHQNDAYLTPDEKQMVTNSARAINQALGYDVNAIDFAFRDGMLYAVDVTNPVPDFDVSTLTPYFFDLVVQKMADFTIGLALDQARQIFEFSRNERPLPRLPAAPPPLDVANQPPAYGRQGNHHPRTNGTARRVDRDGLWAEDLRKPEHS